MKLRTLIALFSVIVFMAACNNDSDSSNPDANGGDSSALTPGEQTIAEEDSTLHTIQEGEVGETPGAPKINSSYFGMDNNGYEVTYNFLPDGKFERFSFKNGDEKNLAGTYTEANGSLTLSSSEGAITLQKKEGNVYNVVKNGSTQYTVELIK